MSKDLAEKLIAQIKEAGLPEPIAEYKFCPWRAWRFDVAYPTIEIAGGGRLVRCKIAFEVEGGTFGAILRCQKCGSVVLYPKSRVPVRVGGRHVQGVGFEKDIEKYNAAYLMGWTIYRVTPGMLRTHQAVELVRIAIDNQGIIDFEGIKGHIQKWSTLKKRSKKE